MDLNIQEITTHASWVLGVFLIGYIAIIIEEVIKFNKAATALIMAVTCWTILFLEPAESSERHLNILTVQLFKVSQVLFFLMGALTIVEIINAHRGFQIITNKLMIRSKRTMLWVAGFITFFLSSILDNLTTTIVMISMIAKLVEQREERLLFGGMIVIAANVGGAWTPIGDVATTLLWIYGQVSTLAIMRDLFIPSIFGLIACLIWFSFKLKGEFTHFDEFQKSSEPEPGGTLVLFLGVCALIFVPIFKVLTDLPPFMGVMLGLGVMWIITDLLHFRYPERQHLLVIHLLPKVDKSILLFYLGILLSINALESAGLLKNMSLWLNHNVSSPLIIPIILGLISSVVDNVSLVAATIGMYGLSPFPMDSTFWQAIAYSAGTGGSILIIGSAAGIALMSLEKVDFIEYTKRIAIPALLTYFVGLFLYFLLSPITKLLE